jgi:hypothetical protein
MRVFSTILFAILLAGCSDVVENSHPTLAAAEQDIERGWVPSVLPASTVQIRESHDLDTNIGHGTFAFGTEDLEQFKAALAPLASGAHILRVQIPRQQMEREGYSFYTYRDFYLAVDWSRRCGEFWLAHSQ